jgi:hypothetical protein
MFQTGSIKNNWPDDLNFSWLRQPLKDSEISLWNSQGYSVKNYSGLMYDNKNPMPDWIYDIGNNFTNLKNKTYTIYQMNTCDIMPTHVDHYETYCKIFKVDRSQVLRIIVFLKDWMPGHYFEISRTGIVNWKKGDWVMWDCDEPHAAANIGVEPRYTLQITGHV